MRISSQRFRILRNYLNYLAIINSNFELKEKNIKHDLARTLRFL